MDGLADMLGNYSMEILGLEFSIVGGSGLVHDLGHMWTSKGLLGARKQAGIDQEDLKSGLS